MNPQTGCVPITRYALGRTRAMGPMGLLLYVTLLRMGADYGHQFKTSHKALLAESSTSYGTIRKALRVLEDLELLTYSTTVANAADENSLVVTLTRRGCAFACPSACGQREGSPVDNSVDCVEPDDVALSRNGTPIPLTCDDASLGTKPQVRVPGVPNGDTALPTGLARARTKAQVTGTGVLFGDTAPENGGGGGGLYIEGMDLSLEGLGLRSKGSDRIAAVFDAWVAFGLDGRRLTQHKAVTASMKKAIVKALTALDKSHGADESLSEITAAIRNYGVCLHDATCQWSYAWTLTDFLNRGLEQFLDEARPVERERVAMKGNGKSIRPPTGTTFKANRSDAFAGL